MRDRRRIWGNLGGGPITTDVSPYGLGAVLEVGDSVTSFFSDRLSRLDCTMLSVGYPPSSDDRQVLEAFAILVALRHWYPQWRDRRVQLAVRTDNVSALQLLCKIETINKGLTQWVPRPDARSLSSRFLGHLAAKNLAELVVAGQLFCRGDCNTSRLDQGLDISSFLCRPLEQPPY